LQESIVSTEGGRAENMRVTIKKLALLGALLLASPTVALLASGYGVLTNFSVLTPDKARSGNPTWMTVFGDASKEELADVAAGRAGFHLDCRYFDIRTVSIKSSLLVVPPNVGGKGHCPPFKENSSKPSAQLLDVTQEAWVLRQERPVAKRLRRRLTTRLSPRSAFG